MSKLTVIDQDGESVSDYNLFVKDRPQTAVPDGVRDGDVEVTKTGYSMTSAGVQPDGSVLVLLEKQEQNDKNLAVSIQPSAGNEEVTLIPPTGAPQTVTAVGGAAQFGSLASGTYTVRVHDVTGQYSDREQTTVVQSAQNNVTIVPVKISDKGNLQPAIAAADQDVADLAPEDSIALDEPVDEDTYSNTAFEGYFTSAQVRVYIGEFFIDELFSIQYALQANTVPIYGYASRFADAYASGRSLVQGQLVLNHVTEGYLRTVLRALALPTDQAVDDKDSEAIAKLIRQKQKLMADHKAVAVSKGTVETPSLLQMSSNLDKRIADAIAGSSPQAVAGAKRRLDQLRRQPDQYANAVYEEQIFNIVIEIGYGDWGPTHRRRLEAVKLVSNEQIIDQSGQPLYDAYGFIARRIR